MGACSWFRVLYASSTMGSQSWACRASARCLILGCACEHVALLSCGMGACSDYKVPYASICYGLAIMGTQGFSALRTVNPKTQTLNPNS